MIERKRSWIHRFLKWIGLIKEYEIDKNEMCKRVKNSGVCSQQCENCVWNSERGKTNETR